MAITTSYTNVAKVGYARGRNSVSHTYKIALYHDSASLNSATTRYLTSGEISGSGYTAGGQAIASLAITASSNNAILDFADINWTASTFTTAGALLYNDSSSSKEAVATFAFGGTKQVSTGTFTLIPPVPASGTAIIEWDNS